MANEDIVEIACTRAWGAYLLIRRGIGENDDLRTKMRDYISDRWKAGTEESEPLAVEGLKYLKALDGSQAGE